MSAKNGDKARYHLQRLARIHQREKVRAQFADQATPKAASEKKAEPESD